MKRILMAGSAAALLTFTIQAYNNSLGLLGWSDTDIRRAVQDPLRSGMSYSPLWLVKTQAQQTLRGMDEQARANFIKEVLPAVKAVVMSAEYGKQHEDHIRTSYQAVNHGVKIGEDKPHTADDAMKAMQDVVKQIAAQMALNIRSMPAQSVKMLFDEDLGNWKQQAADKENEDRAKYQKLVARSAQILPLASSNAEEFKNQYSLLKHIEAGGSGVESDIVTSNGDDKKQQEQRAWNEYNLRTLLKKRLNEFVQVASSVDFAAQTTGEGRARKFVKAEYERKPAEWKTLFRLGRAPTTAAADFAREWLKEL
jgi:hypothetical protein